MHCSRYFVYVVSNYLNHISRAVLWSYFIKACGYLEPSPRPHKEKEAWDLNHLWLPPELLLTTSPLQWPFKMTKWFSLFKILQRLLAALPMRLLTFLLVPQAPGTRSACQLPFVSSRALSSCWECLSSLTSAPPRRSRVLSMFDLSVSTPSSMKQTLSDSLKFHSPTLCTRCL